MRKQRFGALRMDVTKASPVRGIVDDHFFLRATGTPLYGPVVLL